MQFGFVAITAFGASQLSDLLERFRASQFLEIV